MMYIRRAKILLLYMLSISTGRNQNIKVRVDNKVQHKEYNYKVFTRHGIILQVYYITDRHKSTIYNINSTKEAHEL